MTRVHLFNPENDLALAADTPCFTPPRGAALLRDAGMSLPAWWADPGDCVLGVDETEASRLADRWGLHIATGATPSDAVPSPWGWSAYARRLFSRAGVAALPDDFQIESLRMLSHRRTAMEFLRVMEIDDVDECRTVAEAETAVSRRGSAVVKSPWSCSGRGVMFTRGIPRAELRRHLEGIIRRQGSVMVEPELRRVADFAALFDATADGLEFVGWSLFSTASNGAYTGNLVAPQAEIETRLEALIPRPLLIETVDAVKTHLGSLLGGVYRGPLGVDMMACAGKTPLRPCIEVNLRRTMGRVAMDIYSRTGMRGVLAFSPSVRDSDAVLSLSPAGAGFILQPA